MTIQWLFNGYPMTIRWLSESNDYPMTIRWLYDDYPMTIRWLSGDYPTNDSLMTIQWLSDDYLMTILWLSDDYPMRIRWLSDDYLMTIQWLSDDYPMTIQWLSDDYPMTIQWLSRTKVILFCENTSLNSANFTKLAISKLKSWKVCRTQKIFYTNATCYKLHVCRRPLVPEDDLENSIKCARQLLCSARHGYTTHWQRVKS